MPEASYRSCGTAFTNAYCMGAMQGAVCVPSRAMVMSGRTLFHIKPDLKGIPTWPAVAHSPAREW